MSIDRANNDFVQALKHNMSLINYSADESEEEEPDEICTEDSDSHSDSMSSPDYLHRFAMNIRDDSSYEDFLRLTEMMGDVNKGVDFETIRKFTRKFIFNSDQEERCSICLDSYKESDHGRILCCDHVFHAKCIEKWFKKSKDCPICKGEFFDSSL